jgi:phosphopantetheine--protein transferase-like protein
VTLQSAADGAAGRFAERPSRPDVWVIDHQEEAFLSLAEAAPVAEEDRIRVGAVTREEPRRALMARRVALRVILGTYLARDSESLRIVTSPGGKPTLVPTVGDPLRLTFSVTHSGELLCIAVSSSASLGLDVERYREVSRALSIASRWFSEREAEELRATAEADQGVAFIRTWAAKEALAKRHGAGIRLMSGKTGDLELGSEAADGRLVTFSPRPGYAGALASSEAIVQPHILRPGNADWLVAVAALTGRAKA